MARLVLGPSHRPLVLGAALARGNKAFALVGDGAMRPRLAGSLPS